MRRYEPAIRLAVHVRLTDPGLRRLLDSMDICQSVLASFFLRAASGEYDIADPGQLLQLLSAMARNKLAHQIRKHRAQCRMAQSWPVFFAREWKQLSEANGVPILSSRRSRELAEAGCCSKVSWE